MDAAGDWRGTPRTRFQQLRRRGVLYSMGGFVNRLVPAWLFRFRIFRVYQLRPLDSFETPGGPPLEFHWASSMIEIELAEALTFFHSPEKDGSDRFRACIAKDGQEIVGGVWQGTRFFDEDELGARILLTPHQAWIFAAYVSKSHRGARIYPRLLNHVLAESDELTHYASINTTNRASLAAHRHFVVAATGRCLLLRIGSLAVCLAGRGLKPARWLTLDSKRQPIEIRIT